jgi:hypothetical protein
MENQLCIQVTPFTSEILGANSKFIFIKEKNLENEEIDEWYVLRIKRTHFNKMIKLWIATKADYCERYNHFCGVFGSFAIETKEYGETNLLVDSKYDSEKDELTPIYKKVKVLSVLSFDEYCDMEHG